MRRLGIACFLVAASCWAQLVPLSQVEILGNAWPRAYFFRISESLAAGGRYTFAQWDAIFNRLMGIEGKVLDEEVPGRSVNVPYFTGFKNAHPNQLVLLHFNGKGRDPIYDTSQFFAGHWLYYQGSSVVADVPAQQADTDIQVAKGTYFRMGQGAYKDTGDDIALCVTKADGTPDWNQCEQVKLLSVDLQHPPCAARALRNPAPEFCERPRLGRGSRLRRAVVGWREVAVGIQLFYDLSPRFQRPLGERRSGGESGAAFR